MTTVSGTLITTLGTGAVADGSQTEIRVSKALLFRGRYPEIWVLDLAGAETALLWKWINGGWEPVENAGTQVTYTATQKHATVSGSGIYGITKSSSAAAIPVWLEGL